MTGMTGRPAPTNWAGNVRYGARRVLRPTSIDELRDIVGRSDRVRAAGTGHSFNLIGDAATGTGTGETPGDLVTLRDMPRSIEVDPVALTVTVGGGVSYAVLAAHLDAAGFALHNLASLPHISVAGAVATGTHGSGPRHGNLATAVTAIEYVTAAGDIVTLSRTAPSGEEPDTFYGAVVALGALGIVTRLTLQIEPAYQVRQWVYEGLPWQRLAADLDHVMSSGYSVSVLTRWTSPRADYVFRKQLVSDDESTAQHTWLDATLADVERHPVIGLPPDPCTPQLGVPGPWHERLPHFRPEFTPSVGAEVQSEFFVPREHGPAAIAAVREIGALLDPVLMVSELRTVAADDLWLSPAYRRDSLAIHFTWSDDVPAVTAVLPAIEKQLAPFAPRPHWGKLFTMAPDAVAATYERRADFGRLRRRLDPTDKFGNDFVAAHAPASSDNVDRAHNR